MRQRKLEKQAGAGPHSAREFACHMKCPGKMYEAAAGVPCVHSDSRTVLPDPVSSFLLPQGFLQNYRRRVQQEMNPPGDHLQPEGMGIGGSRLQPPVFQMGNSRKTSVHFSEILVHPRTPLPSVMTSVMSPLVRVGPSPVPLFLLLHSCFRRSTPKSITCTKVPVSSFALGGPHTKMSYMAVI